MIRRSISEQARTSKINKVQHKQLEYSFHEAFPQVFGNYERQGCNLAQYTTKMIIKSLKDSRLDLYYQKYGQRIKNIKQDLAYSLKKKAQINYQQKYEYLLQSEYGCAIVLQRTSSISNIFVYIVFSTAWQTSLEFNLEVIKQYPANPQSFEHILLGQIQSSQIPLTSAMPQIIKYARAIIENNEKNLKAKCNSAAYLIDVVQKAISLIKIQNGSSIGAVQYDMKVRSNQKILPKGGIYDVGISAGRTKPDTILPVLLALVHFFTKNKQFVQAYQMEYKIYLLDCFVERLDSIKQTQEKQLSQQIKQESKQESKQKQRYQSYQLQKQRIQKVIRCMQLITAELAQFYNKYIKKSKVRKILQKIADKINNYCQKKFNIKPLSLKTEEIINSQENKAETKNKSSLFQVIAYDRLIINQQNLQKINYFKGFQSKKSQQLFSYLITELTNLLAGDGNYKKISDKMRQLQIVQDVLLTIALNHIPNHLDFREFRVQIGSLWKLANAYQSATLEMKKSSDQNQSPKRRTNNQIMSFFWLIKTIIAIIGFQIAAQKIPQLKGFKVPIDFDKIYDNLTSSSAKAHAAARCIKSYFKQRQEDKKFFLLSNQVSEETQTFIKIYYENNGLQQIYNKKFEELQKQIILLTQTVKTFQQKYKKQYSRIIQYKQLIEGNTCECGEVIQYKWLGSYINLQTKQKSGRLRPGFEKDMRQYVNKITCYYHNQIQKLEKQIDKMYRQRNNQKIKVDFSHKNYQQIIFFQSLDVQLGHLIDLILFCQIGERTTNQKYKLKDFNIYNDNQIQLKQQDKFHFDSTISKYKGLTKFDMLEIPTYLVSQQVMYLNSKISLSIFRVSNQFDDFHKLSQISDRQFCNQHSSWKGLKFIIDPPLVMSNPQQLPCQRQHKIYQKLSNLPKNITQSQFILFASLRCTTDTELIILLSQILKRNLIILHNDEHKEIKSKIIHSIFRRLKSNQDLYCEQFDKRTYWTIYNFLQSYGDSLTQNDFRFFPILGPLIAFMCARINNVQKEQWNYAFYPTQQPLKHEKLLTTILKQALSHYSKLQQQIQKKNFQIIQGKAKQKLILFQALCCFTQQLLTSKKQYSQVTELFIKVYLLYGHITIQQTQGFQSYLKIMIDNNHILSRTTFCNISTMVEYCQKHVDRFVSIIDYCYHIKIMQPNIKKQGFYILQIQCKNVKNKIKIDFCNGFSTINSRQILKLSENASKLAEYKQLFGTVQYQTTYTGQLGNSLKINKNFKLMQMDLINQGQKEILQPINYTKVQFELKKPKIKQFPNYMILMRIIQNQNQNEYLCLPLPKYIQSTGIPEYYMYKYRPWLNQKQKYIVFKQPYVEQIHKTALIMKINQNFIIKLFVIPKHHSILSVSTLLKNINKYQQLQPHFQSVQKYKKQQKLTLKQPKDILLKIQKQHFIHVLINPDKKIGKRYWLHRYDLNFIMYNNIGLIPTIFSGYKVSHTPFTHQYVPWTEQDDIPCIVLQKIQQNQFTLQSHKIKLVIPNLEYVDNKFKIPFEVDKKISIYTYDIHDHFHDIRGYSRESQIYLALLLIHTNKGFRQKQMNITPIQQAMQVLKTCFNNRPLNSAQLSKITSIIKISIHKNYYSILLMCEALLIATKQLVGIYKQISTNHIDDNRNQSYFQSIIQYWQQNSQQKLSKIYNQVLPRAKYIYEQLNNIKAIPMRLNIPQQYASLLGIRKQSASDLSQEQQKQQEQFMINEEVIRQIQIKIKKALKQVEIIKDKMIKSGRGEQIQINKFKLNLKGSKLLGKQIQKQFMKSTQCFKKQIAIQKQIQKIQFKNYLPDIKECMEHLELICSYIQQFINKKHIHHNAPRRLQRKVGLDPRLTLTDFTKVVVDSYINDLYPIAYTQQRDLIINLVIGWLKLKVQSDSLKRLKIRINDTNIDVIQIMRQCESPRQQVYKRPYWLCFQVQMKLQIWLSQFQTYKCLFNQNQDNMKEKGRFSQLNMGQGKTQTIIPMIVLQKIFQDKKQYKQQKQKGEKRTPRINCLSSLYSQVFSNFFKFLSVTGFKIPILELPFERSIKFTNETIKSIRRSFLQFANRSLALINQSSSHSMILKQRQKFIISKISNQELSHKDDVIFQGIKFFDIFDQIDALMSPKKQFVYSLQLNNKNQFQLLQLRTKICKLLLQEVWSLQQKIINQRIGVLDNVQSDNNQMSRIRLIINSADDSQKIYNFRSQIYDKVIRKITQTSFIFRQENNQRERDQIKKYVIKSSQTINYNWKLPEITLNALYILRGSLAIGVLQHSLSLRYRIQYGLPDKQRILTTRLAVPYEAAEVPSKKNQFSHPQVTIYLTYLAYYYEGLSFDGFFNVLTFVSKLKHIQRLQIYQQWLSYSKNNQIKMKNFIDLNLQNITEIKKLYSVMYKNKRIVEGWLQHFVLQKQLIHFPHVITSSSWDLSCVQKSVGFSGTKDCSILFPTYIKYQPSQNIIIRATDAKMINLVIDNTNSLIQLKNSQDPLWIKLIDKCMQEKASCLIDVGAYLAGKSIQKQVIPYIIKHNLFNVDRKLKGIAFYSLNKKNWSVYNLSNKQIISLRTLIQDHETFVIFDQYRTRGADLRMDKNIKAILTLSSNLPKDDFMQAVGRLRKLGRNQKLTLVMTTEVRQKIQKTFEKKINHLQFKKQIQLILNWSSSNSLREIQQYIYCHSNHAKIHLENQINSPNQQQCKISPQYMYSKQLKNITVRQQCSRMFQKIKNVQKSKQEHKNMFHDIVKLFQKYGSQISIQVNNFDQQTEKQKEMNTQKITQKQPQAINELSITPVRAIMEDNQFKFVTNKSIEWLKYFNFQYISFTRNFVRCTEVLKAIITVNNQEKQQNFKEHQSQLQHCFFVFLKKKNDNLLMNIITQRQASTLFRKKQTILYVSRLDIDNYYRINLTNGVLAMLDDLTINSPIIRQNNLENSLVQIKLYNGIQDYTEPQCYLLHRLFYRSMEAKNNLRLSQITQYFLKRRHLKEKIYPGSRLQSYFQKFENNLLQFKNMPNLAIQ